MPLVVPSASEDRLLGWMLNTANSSNQTLKLFKTNVTVSASTVVGDLTEADFSGYSAKTLTRGSWTVTQVSSKASASYSDQTFTASSGSQTLYGYYIVDNSGNLLWAENFTSSKTIDSSNPLVISLKFTLASEN